MIKSLIRTMMVVLTAVLFSVPAAIAGQDAPRTTVDIAHHPFKGPEHASVVMVVFSDYL